MGRLFAILEGVACLLVFACIGTIAEIVVIGILDLAGVFRAASLNPGWVIAVPAVFGIAGLRLGLARTLETIMLYAGVEFQNAQRFAYAWVAGVFALGAAIWFAVAQAYPPFADPHWTIAQTLMVALLVGGPPMFVLLVARAALWMRRSNRRKNTKA